MLRAIGVEGVGEETQVAVEEVIVPGVIRSTKALGVDTTYAAPVLPDSDVPALLGLRSLTRMRAILDIGNRVLYMCGHDAPRIVTPAGYRAFQLTMSSSGHLLLPFSNFEGINVGEAVFFDLTPT
eukprot:12393384-Heterocapsa_arctica.AAC.1